jgi:hypothetical protein
MAVVQISRIQIRRGQKNQGTGIPQLASGELAWAIDTQELYIGAGAVSEGSPAVGNTKIVTIKDNLLELVNQYRYKRNNPFIQTSSDPNNAITLSLEERLDHRVTNASYGILDNDQDMTIQIQHAIDNLFITNKSSGQSQRVTLEFLPGKYVISSTIYIPSYLSIVGSGPQKTIFDYKGTNGPVFRFINDTSTISTRNFTIGLNANLYNNTGVYNQQPRNIILKNFSVKVNELDTACFLMESVRDSIFEDLEIIGNYDWYAGVDSSVPIISNNFAFNLQGFSSLITSKNNKFRNISISRYIYSIVSDYDILNNTWEDCQIKESKYGFIFGQNTSNILGQRYGPSRNIIKNSYFNDIKENGISVINGYGNVSTNNIFINVGNDGSGNFVTADGSSIIRFVTRGNISSNDLFDRAHNNYYNEQTSTLIDYSLAGSNYGYRYYQEVEGSTYFINNASNIVTLLPQISNAITAFRIPFSGETSLVINYLLKINTGRQMRRGTLSVAVDDTNNDLCLSDDYDYVGSSGQDLNIVFSADFDASGTCILIKYTNINTTYPSTLAYVYSALS